MNKKLRIEVLKSKVRRVVDLLEIIRVHLPKDYANFKKSRMVKDAVYKEVETAVEYILDICNVINSDLGLGMPEKEEDIFDNLGRDGILSAEKVKLIKNMKKFRNILVHRYGEIDDELAFETIKDGLDDFKKIILDIEKFVDKR